MVPSVKHGGSSIMVWGCFGSAGVGSLVSVTEHINSQVYVDTLCDHLLPAVHRLVGPEFIFQHDNALPHNAAVTREFLANPTPEFIREMGGNVAKLKTVL